MSGWITLWRITQAWLRRRFRPTRLERLRDWSARLGRRGEQAARLHLENAGYEVLCGNYRAPHGVGEIDLVARDASGTLCFVEVKCRRLRRERDLPQPLLAVDESKRQRIRRSARAYLRACGVQPRFRFDVIEVWAKGRAPWRLRHWADAFAASPGKNFGKY